MAPEPMSEPVDRLKCPNCGQTGPHFVIGDPGAFACEPTPTSGYLQTDAPPCPTCGSIMVPSGPPFRCLNCAPPAAVVGPAAPPKEAK